jgi:hypothetical protein
MQDERVHICSKLGNKEWNAVSHQARDEVNVATEPVQLGYCDGALLPPRVIKGSGKLGPAVQGIRTLACLDLNEDPGQLEALRGREAS